MSVTFTLQGVPPSWSNTRMHHMALAREKSGWREMSHWTAGIARIGAHMELPSKKCAVTIELRRRRLLDHDNAYASVKPILDGLKGQLIYDDSPRWCDLVVRQVQDKTERVIVIVSEISVEEIA